MNAPSETTWPRIKTLCSILVLLCVLPSGLHAEDQAVDFAREILPILSDKCFVCHGPDTHANVEAGTELQLDSYVGATRDLEGHRAIDPGALDKSELLSRIHSADDPMPPVDAEKQLTPQERELLNRWVLSGGEYAMHWAFVPPQKVPPQDVTAQKVPPDTTNGSPTVNTIDAFVDARLQRDKLTMAPVADPATLARRASLVLTGLPPQPEALAAFLRDDRPDAYERFVDSQLDSPHFGEHQARYWLDAVRYGDTHGLHLDNKRGIYPYRDWVIHAFNQNLPLDQFITWQLAGDLLPVPTLQQLVATGFVRMNPTTAEGGAIPEEFQAKNNFDRVETFGTVFLGMSLTCARCHTHKYDPILQTEYYELMAFFNSTAESSMDGNQYEYAPVVKAPDGLAAWKLWDSLEAARSELIHKAAALLDQQEGVAPDVRQTWNAAQLAERLAMIADPQGPFATDAVHQDAVTLAQNIEDAQKAFTTTLVAQELPSPRITRLLSRGEYDLPAGEPLQPNTFSVMGAFPADAPRNRLGLSQWLTSRQHPLVARVLINRFWQQVFGHGLVRTPEDFGLQGQQPTHPQLLDWLAVELQDSGWDLKHMLRLMVTSRTFQQSSARRSDVSDPENLLFARGPSHRLDAEVIRDIGLWASGLLDPEMGGEGVKPYQPAGLWEALMHPASNTKSYVPDDGQKIYRRSLYVYWKRTSPHPMMTLFDAPSRESSCVRRSRTNTSLQSLALFNETQRVEMARVLAERLIHEAQQDAERLNRLFRLIASRTPSERERAACMTLLESMRERYSAAGAQADAVALISTGNAARDQALNPAEHAAWTQLASTVLASDLCILLY